MIDSFCQKMVRSQLRALLTTSRINNVRIHDHFRGGLGSSSFEFLEQIDSVFTGHPSVHDHYFLPLFLKNRLCFQAVMGLKDTFNSIHLSEGVFHQFTLKRMTTAD